MWERTGMPKEGCEREGKAWVLPQPPPNPQPPLVLSSAPSLCPPSSLSSPCPGVRGPPCSPLTPPAHLQGWRWSRRRDPSRAGSSGHRGVGLGLSPHPVSEEVPPFQSRTLTQWLEKSRALPGREGSGFNKMERCCHRVCSCAQGAGEGGRSPAHPSLAATRCPPAPGRATKPQSARGDSPARSWVLGEAPSPLGRWPAPPDQGSPMGGGSVLTPLRPSGVRSHS